MGEDYVRRFHGRIDRRHIAPATISIVGVGRVGGPVAWELARLVPRRLILVDGDDYEIENLAGHLLPTEYVGWNKAVGMAAHLQQQIPGIEDVTAVPHFIDTSASGDQPLLAEVIEPATVLVIATDDIAVQRHVAAWAQTDGVPPSCRELPRMARAQRRSCH